MSVHGSSQRVPWSSSSVISAQQARPIITTLPVSEVKRPHRPLVFEKYPDYIRSSSAITTIRSLLPGIKLVGILIRSVRAQLHHQHLLHAGIGSEALFLQVIIRSSHQPIVMLWWWRSTLRQALRRWCTMASMSNSCPCWFRRASPTASDRRTSCCCYKKTCGGNLSITRDRYLRLTPQDYIS